MLDISFGCSSGYTLVDFGATHVGDEMELDNQGRIVMAGTGDGEFGVAGFTNASFHHFGSRPFVGNGGEQLSRPKWASEPGQLEVSPDAEAPSKRCGDISDKRGDWLAAKAVDAEGLLLVSKAICVSMCLIARDSTRTLGACLRSIRPWVDEMIVVDTGSTDDTPHLARQHGASVFHFPWCDDFAAARNESVRHARGAWIFWMDSDDTIDAVNGQRLRELTTAQADPTILGFVMQVHCPGRGLQGMLDITAVDHVKLFRNRPELRFTGRIHEQIIPAIRALGGKIAWTDIFVKHSGSDQTEEGRRRKQERDLRLLQIELSEQPEHPFALFNLGMTYADMNDDAEAIVYLKRALAAAAPNESHVRKIFALLVASCTRLGQSARAMNYCTDGLSLFPKDPELLFCQGILFHQAGKLAEAVHAYQSVLSLEDDQPHFASLDRGIRGYKARHNLAIVFTDLGMLESAEAQWREMLREVPNYELGWRRLVETMVQQRKFSEAESELYRLPRGRLSDGQVLTLRAYIAEARGDLSAAVEHLRAAAQVDPLDPEPLRAWGALLFKAGKIGMAEPILRALIERAPNDAAAYHNLGVACLSAGRKSEAAKCFQKSLDLRPNSLATRQLLRGSSSAFE